MAEKLPTERIVEKKIMFNTVVTCQYNNTRIKHNVIVGGYL